MHLDNGEEFCRNDIYQYHNSPEKDIRQNKKLEKLNLDLEKDKSIVEMFVKNEIFLS